MRKSLVKAIGLSILAVFLLQISLFATQERITEADKGWKNKKAYRPYPVLFLHGFAKGNPKSWEKAIPEIEKYFSDYYIPEDLPENFKNGYLYNSDKNPANRYYLEIINFADPNGSVDTYGVTSPSNSFQTKDGWADTLDKTIEDLLSPSKYGGTEPPNLDKLLLVAHSMGGLAGREFISKYPDGNKVASLTMTGTPNLGTEWADVAEGMSKHPKKRKFPFFIRWVVSKGINLLNEVLDGWTAIDINGEAIWDTTTDSQFLGTLNGPNRPVKQLGVKYFVVPGTTDKLFWALSNEFLFHEPGDGVVSQSSQAGEGLNESVFPLESVTTMMDTSHLQECTNIATSGALIRFLDYTPPVLKITKVGDETFVSGKKYETTTSSIKIEGTLADEYLPADTKIKYQVYDENDQPVFPDEQEITAPDYYPLDVTQLDSSDSEKGLVAGFEKDISLEMLEEKTYTVTIYAINPGGKKSEVQSFSVVLKVLPTAIFCRGFDYENNIIIYLAADKKTWVEYNIDTGSSNQAEFPYTNLRFLAIKPYVYLYTNLSLPTLTKYSFPDFTNLGSTSIVHNFSDTNSTFIGMSHWTGQANPCPLYVLDNSFGIVSSISPTGGGGIGMGENYLSVDLDNTTQIKRYTIGLSYLGTIETGVNWQCETGTDDYYIGTLVYTTYPIKFFSYSSGSIIKTFDALNCNTSFCISFAKTKNYCAFINPSNSRIQIYDWSFNFIREVGQR